MKKALMLASVASMIDQFNIPNIKILLSLGYSVDVVADYTNPGNISKERSEDLIKRLKELGANPIDIPVPRSINPKVVLKAYILVKKLISTEHYNLIHCHSPIGGAITRIAAKSERKNGCKVIYTAHGFHFYKGAPLKNWIVFYPIEKILSKFTDVLITINKEDYERATKKFKAKQTVYVPGIGVDTEKFNKSRNGNKIRKEFGLNETDILYLSVGELNDNKNHEVVIRGLSKIEEKPYYIIVGKGDKKEYLQSLVNDLGLQDKVIFAGFRQDVADFYDAADVFIFPSFREGLSVALMEAMASGLPVVCGKIRGNTDLIDCEGGFFFDPHNINSVVESIKNELNADRNVQKNYNMKKIQQFSLDNVNKHMISIYKNCEV
ncbi:Glycosyltransferase involved in cell wall bisynthesis [Treponema bryantii]|uniref:Glycosyltransferase involved in cell wall bisynthesis n=1 Tax=Treponema bryantii TaxID=163 RepID=A0A1I3N8T1_9SPIR|nr:glycosyltransferase family 4 protein [Treponema bryantii]SFJ05721.1 Glycosyltransferase involved in cell wall bisynthesis [Treponema bryantii]